MIVIESISEIKDKVISLKKEGKSIGFIPTMGALHQGHLSLVEKAREENDIIVCSIYVNPTQFNNIEDYNKYPSTVEQDISLLKTVHCDILFLPKTKDIYKQKSLTSFQFGSIENVMEGKHRPGHFNGVALIVSKLFNIISPDAAYFGQKDHQQLAIIKQLVTDLSYNINIQSCPTLREESGLAMSSRNQRLSDVEKEEATLIYKSLCRAKDSFKKGTSVSKIIDDIKDEFSKSNLELEYFEFANAQTLQPIIKKESQVVICVAAFLGNVRLIDNIII